MKKISVIMPVYNSENFIERSINSVLHQTINNDIELIIINDGSRDNSQKIIDKYVKEYPETIKTKYIKNSGASSARNEGLKLATGEYIGFLDDDDYIDEMMYEKLYTKAKSDKSDIVVCGYYVENENNMIAYQIGGMHEYGKSAKENPNLFICGVPYLWNKIFKRELITKNNIKFKNELRVFEDLNFTYKLFVEANKISKVAEPLYYYGKLNDNSLTRNFTYKFFDIIPSIKDLKEYMIIKNVYKDLEDYVLYTALNHIYIRCNMRVSLSQLGMKYKYIDETFKFLDEEFSNWKNHELYFSKTKKDKKKYTSKRHFKILSFNQSTRLIKIKKKFKKTRRKFKKYNSIGYTYYKYYRELPVNDNIVLLDSQHGNDINGNMFYIIKELVKKEYGNLEIYLGVQKNRYSEFRTKLDLYNLTNVKLVLVDTKKYMKLLATAKYLFSDTSFVANFIKRDEQVYLNTWHGTPLKTLGRSSKSDYQSIPNLQKNFIMADYLLYPSEYMINHMLEDYMLNNIAKNKILLCGYPRNEVFFDEKRRIEIKKELNLENYELITYMPTWRGTLSAKDTDEYVNTLREFLEYWSNELKDNQIMFVKVHPYVKDYVDLNGYDKIKPFPLEYETYDFLNTCDILITDYSSVFFDYALTKNKIILFAYDEKKYLNDRGLYFNFSDLPFKKVYTKEEVIEEINDSSNVNYDKFLKEFCNYDAKDISKKICNKLILNKKNNLKVMDMPSNNKENVLILVKNFSNKNINKVFFKLLNNTNKLDCNYYISYISRSVKKYSYNLFKLPNEVRYLGQMYTMCNVCAFDKFKFMLGGKKYKFNINFSNKRYDYIFKDELKRNYYDIDFKTVILIGEDNPARIKLYSKFDNSKKILITDDVKLKNRFINDFDYICSIEELKSKKNINDIVKIKE